jgi:Bacterial Ig domain/Chitobiase/beta-hexosaminidase C-terminal domain
VAGLRYTTNGSTPNASSAIYTAPIKLTATETVKFLPFDNAGNAGSVKSVLVNVDTVKPTVKVTASSVSSLSTGTFRFTAKAKDTSKIVRVSFYLDKKFKRSDTGAPFTFSWSPAKAKKGSHTLTVKATDIAGNVGVKVITVKVR